MSDCDTHKVINKKIFVMARNRLAGSKSGKSKSAKHYHDNPKSRKKKQEYDKEYHSTPERKKYRAQLQKENKKRGTHGNLDGKDLDHTSKKTMKQRDASKNRGDKTKKVFKNKR